MLSYFARHCVQKSTTAFYISLSSLLTNHILCTNHISHLSSKTHMPCKAIRGMLPCPHQCLGGYPHLYILPFQLLYVNG